MSGTRLTLAACERVLASKNVVDYHRMAAAIGHFQARGRNPSTDDLAELLGWTVERVEAAGAELMSKGYAKKNEGRTPPKS